MRLANLCDARDRGSHPVEFCTPTSNSYRVGGRHCSVRAASCDSRGLLSASRSTGIVARATQERSFLWQFAAP